MAITQIQIQGTAFDVYGSIAELDLYVVSSILPAGVTFTSDFARKQKLLVTATRIFERTGWAGTPTDLVTPQPLAWPRIGVLDRNGQPVPNNVLPEDVESGFFELAIFLDQDTTGSLQATGTTGTNVRRTRTKRKVGELETEDEQELFVPTASGVNRKGRLPNAVLEFVAPYLAGGLGSAAGEASGANRCSEIDGANEFLLDIPGFS